jgi:hypothetical protein
MAFPRGPVRVMSAVLAAKPSLPVYPKQQTSLLEGLGRARSGHDLSVNNLIDTAALMPVTSSARPSNVGDTMSSGLRRNNFDRN